MIDNRTNARKAMVMDIPTNTYVWIMSKILVCDLFC